VRYFAFVFVVYSAIMDDDEEDDRLFGAFFGSAGVSSSSSSGDNKKKKMQTSHKRAHSMEGDDKYITIEDDEKHENSNMASSSSSSSSSSRPVTPPPQPAKKKKRVKPPLVRPPQHSTEWMPAYSRVLTSKDTVMRDALPLTVAPPEEKQSHSSSSSSKDDDLSNCSVHQAVDFVMSTLMMPVYHMYINGASAPGMLAISKAVSMLHKMCNNSAMAGMFVREMCDSVTQALCAGLLQSQFRSELKEHQDGVMAVAIINKQWATFDRIAKTWSTYLNPVERHLKVTSPSGDKAGLTGIVLQMCRNYFFDHFMEFRDTWIKGIVQLWDNERADTVSAPSGVLAASMQTAHDIMSTLNVYWHDKLAGLWMPAWITSAVKESTIAWYTHLIVGKIETGAATYDIVAQLHRQLQHERRIKDAFADKVRFQFVVDVAHDTAIACITEQCRTLIAATSWPPPEWMPDLLFNWYGLMSGTQHGKNVFGDTWRATVLSVSSAVAAVSPCDPKTWLEWLASAQSVLVAARKLFARILNDESGICNNQNNNHQLQLHLNDTQTFLSDAVRLRATASTETADLFHRRMQERHRLHLAHTNSAEDDDVLGSVVFAYGSMENRDEFERVYIRTLSTRLLPQFVSYLGKEELDDEHHVLAMLARNDNVSSSFINCANKLLQDAAQWTELNRAVSTINRTMHLGDSGADMHVAVCNSGSWPLQQTVPVKWPLEMAGPLKNYKEAYDQIYTHRKFTVVPQKGWCEVSVRIGSVTVHVVCTAIMASVLCLFNRQQVWTVKDALGALGGLSLDIAKPHLLGLCHKHNKGVVKNPHDKPVILLEDELMLHTSWPHQARRIMLKMSDRKDADAAAKDKDEAEAANRECIALQRKNSVHATAVRVLKAHRTIAHSALYAECVSQLKGRFALESSLFKKSMEELMTLEYVRRDDNDRTIYHYMA
jgi:hypothetical protein